MLCSWNVNISRFCRSLKVCLGKSFILQSRAQLAINKTYLLPDHKLKLKINSCFWFLWKENKQMKVNLQLNFYKLDLHLLSYKNVSQIASRIFITQCLFTDRSLETKSCKLNNLQNTLSRSSPPVSAVV